MFSKTVYGATFNDVNFVPLQSATFCVQCELISSNHRPYCLACGNPALLSLSRLLGGSLRPQQTAHLITDSELGVRLQTDAGISAEAVRTGEVMLCHNAERNPRVDLASCRRLGVRSIRVSPLRYFRRTLGVFEVPSSSPGAFNECDVATMQLLSSMMVAAISRISSLHQSHLLRRPAVET